MSLNLTSVRVPEDRLIRVGGGWARVFTPLIAQETTVLLHHTPMRFRELPSHDETTLTGGLHCGITLLPPLEKALDPLAGIETS
jgi:hypothetical protein